MIQKEPAKCFGSKTADRRIGVVIGFIGLLLIFAPKVPAQAAATNGPSPSPEGPNAYKSLTLE